MQSINMWCINEVWSVIKIIKVLVVYGLQYKFIVLNLVILYEINNKLKIIKIKFLKRKKVGITLLY